MEAKNAKRRDYVIGVMITFFLLSLCLQPVVGQEVVNENEEDLVDTESNIFQGDKESEPGQPETDESSNINKWILYGGGTALIVGVAAIASGSSSGDTSSTCEEVTVGPSIAGSEWSGSLILAYNGSQSVTATITQCGDAVTITTNSSLDYGQSFSGTIDSDGELLAYDSVTGEDWTTHYGSASTTQIKLYDFVNNCSEMDELGLYRTLAADE